MTKKHVLQVLKWVSVSLLALSLLFTSALYFFKDDIIAVVLDEVNDHLKAKVKVEKIDLAFWSSFPNLSVDFNKIFIQDTYENATEKDTLLYTEKIRLRFNPLDLWKENYTLKRIDVYPGTLQLKTNEKGENNFDILKESEDTTSTNFSFDLQKVKIENLRFSYANAKIHHKYATDLIKTELKGKFADKVFTISASSQNLIRETKSGELNFVKNKKSKFDIAVEIDQNKGTLTIPSSTIYIANLPFQFSGFLGPDNMKFTINAKKLALTDVTNNFLIQGVDQVKDYQGAGEVDFNLVISDVYANNSDVSIACDFGVKNGKLVEPSQQLQVNNLNLIGNYSNNDGKGGDVLTLKNISLTTKTGPFTGAIKVSEFDAPRIQGNLKGNLNLAIVHTLFPIPYIDKIGGTMNADADFNVKIHNEKNIEINKSEGVLEFLGDFVQLKDDRRYFHSIVGKVFLKNNDVGVSGLEVKLGDSDLKMDGYFNNVIGFFGEQSKLSAEMNISSTNIKIEDLGTTSKEEQIQTQATRSFILPDIIDGSLNLSLNKMSYEGHVFEQISGHVSLQAREVNFSDVHFKTSGAFVDGSVSIKETSEEYFVTTSKLSSSNISLKQLMKDWNNFKQSVITEENLYGQAAIQLYLEAPFDWRKGINMKQVKSDIYLRIDEGRLKNVTAFNDIIESMKTPAAKLVLGANAIQNFGNKLADLRFETLENTFIIRNGVITIPAMKINSSAINVDLSGTHSIEQVIDYRFAFKLRDIKGKKEYEFGEIIDDNTGMVVYLKMYGTIDKPQFAWDKESRAADRKNYNEQEKQTLKSMLKSEFGMYKKDSTVQRYEEKKRSKEVIEVQVGKEEEDVIQEKKKKEGKTNSFFKKMEQEDKNRKKVEVEFE